MTDPTVRNIVVHDQAFDITKLHRENEYLAAQIEALQDRLPTDEEMTFLRSKKEADDNAAWLWRMVKLHAPWLMVVGSLFASGIYWLATHTIMIGNRP